jgi:hypothetical protein
MKPRLRVVLTATSICLAGVGAGVLYRARPGVPAGEMAAAAARLIGSFPGDQRASLVLPFDDRARTDWHFVPRSRPGVPLAAMNDAQRAAARDLLRAALSSQGVLKVEQIMSLDAVLREIENNPGRDPLQYTFTIYGEPSGDAAGAWGWKVEGHHVSLNFTCVGGRVVGTTPSFLGAHPATVESGPLAGRRAMAVEEDLARELLLSMEDAQRKEAVIAERAPADIITAPGRSLDDAPRVGVAYPSLNDAQRRMLESLIEEYAHNLRRETAEAELGRIRSAGMDAVRFAWAGSSKPGEGHYYRISGPTFIIEYDNTQNRANHVHTVWHDRERDFGQDALREHYRHGHEHNK